MPQNNWVDDGALETPVKPTEEVVETPVEEKIVEPTLEPITE
jgi:hypothetical protein